MKCRHRWKTVKSTGGLVIRRECVNCGTYIGIPSPLVTLGDNIRKKRLDHHMSQEKLAEAAELDTTYISGIERGRRNVSLKALVKIALGLKTTVSELAEGVDE